jgi:hypothetical protein
VIIGQIVINLGLSLFSQQGVGSTPSGMLIENYMPYVRTNAGIKTELPIELSGSNGDLTVGGDLSITSASTFTGAVSFDGAVTNSATVATSSAASATILAADLTCGGSLLVSLPVGSVSLTLPASSTLSSFLPVAGDRCSVAIVNASTTASQNITIVEGTGSKLASTTNAVIQPNSVGILNVVRKANSDFVMLLLKGGYAGGE